MKTTDNERSARLLQQWLNEQGTPVTVDGWLGHQTLTAMEATLPEFDRAKLAETLRGQDVDRTPPAPRTGGWTPAPMPPNPNHWPADNPEALRNHYGVPGANLVRVLPPYPLYYDGHELEQGFACNVLVRPSLDRIFAQILEHYGPARIRALKLDQYSGCYNNRPITGGTRLSTHAWGIAIDWWAARNSFRADHTTAALAGDEYIPFWEIWESEGWISLGRLRNFDWMHVQAARIRG